MRRLLQYFLKRPLTWFANRYSAAPDKQEVFKSLSALYRSSSNKKKKRIRLIDMDPLAGKFIIFSDHHKGNRDHGDDFAKCEPNYIAALEYYNGEGFSYINLGDSEELWKYKATAVLPMNKKALEAEAAFQEGDRYFRSFGNHDIIWKNKMDVDMLLKPYFRLPMPVYEGFILRTMVNGSPLHFFLTHGHQGDKLSDNNAFSTWLVAHIWTPVQRYLRLNVNTPSKDDNLLNKHNKLMYEWSSNRKNIILLTGHTHQPVFASGKYSDHPSNEIPLPAAKPSLKPSYFNSGCCCFNDGDITGIEIAGGRIALIKWYLDAAGTAKRKVLEEITLHALAMDL